MPIPMAPFPLPCARCGRSGVALLHQPYRFPKAQAFCGPCSLAMPGGQHRYLAAEYNHHTMEAAGCPPSHQHKKGGTQ